MTLTELRYLVALPETGHFRKAAQQCNVSQLTLNIALAWRASYPRPEAIDTLNDARRGL